MRPSSTNPARVTWPASPSHNPGGACPTRSVGSGGRARSAPSVCDIENTVVVVHPTTGRARRGGLARCRLLAPVELATLTRPSTASRTVRVRGARIVWPRCPRVTCRPRAFQVWYPATRSGTGSGTRPSANARACEATISIEFPNE